MKKICLAISLVFGLPFLQACSTAPTQGKALTVEPVYTLRHGADNAEAYYQLGRYYQGQERLDLAQNAYQKAVALDSYLSEAHNSLGIVYALQGKFQQALAEFQSLIAAMPNAAHLFNNLGFLHLLEGRQTEAVAAFDRATTLDPANPRAWNNLGQALAKEGDSARANEAFARAEAASAAPPAVAGLDATPPVNEGLRLAMARTLAQPKDLGMAARAAAAALVVPRQEAVTLALARVSSVPAGTAVEVAPGGYEVQHMAGPAAAPQPGGIALTMSYRLEISNGNGITGMARKLGSTLAADGAAPRARLTNQKPFQQRVTQIQYRNGYAAQAAALSSRLPTHPAIVEANNLRPNTDVRVLLGRDLPARVTLADRANVPAERAPGA